MMTGHVCTLHRAPLPAVPNSAPQTRPNEVRQPFPIGVVLVGSAAIALVLGVAFAVSTSTPSRPPTRSTTQGQPAPVLRIAPYSDVAVLRAATPGFRRPGDARPSTTVSLTWSTGQAALPVVTLRRDWIEVRLVQRPNGETAWIKASNASLVRSPFHVVVDLASLQLSLYERGQLKLRTPVAVGTGANPTPTGNFFVTQLTQAPGPGWGPFVVVTSAFANVVTDWEQSGQPVITIHVPVGARQTTIPRTGVRLTSGSVWVPPGVLTRLRPVPLGSPVDVVRDVRIITERGEEG